MTAIRSSAQTASTPISGALTTAAPTGAAAIAATTAYRHIGGVDGRGQEAVVVTTSRSPSCRARVDRRQGGASGRLVSRRLGVDPRVVERRRRLPDAQEADRDADEGAEHARDEGVALGVVGRRRRRGRGSLG